MGLTSGQYPRDLRKVVAHAERLVKVLGEIERARKQDPWFRGRADEVHDAVSLAIADWRSGARDADGAERVLLSYIDSLHRNASKKLRCGPGLACCDLDDVITAVAPEEWGSAAMFATGGAATSQVISEPTIPAPWVDTPEILALFDQGLPFVEVHANSIARRLGPGCTLDDLRASGREGLLDAARSFNEYRGAPFDRWASQRIRNAMIDGVRRCGAIPWRARQRLQAPAPDPTAEEAESYPLAPAHGPRWVALEEHDGAASLAEGVKSRPLTPEDVLARAELAWHVRAVLPKLPSPERALIERSYFNGLTVPEAARAIGISRSWAHRLHTRAMEILGRELRDRERTGAGGRPWAPKKS